jgi:hypothetical protein
LFVELAEGLLAKLGVEVIIEMDVDLVARTSTSLLQNFGWNVVLIHKQQTLPGATLSCVR